MFNFTKKHSNAQVDTNEQAAEISEKYNAAIKKIERLEDELKQTCKAQTIMCEGVKSCVASLYTAQNQLQAVAVYLDRSNQHIFKLLQENRALKSSGDEWFRRAIKLEFDVLTIKDGVKKIEHERDLAIKMCELLQVELMSPDKENSRGRNRL